MNAEPPLIEKHRGGLRPVWVVPLAAVIVGITLLVNNVRERGPHIYITFQSAEGLEVGKTLVKYRDVTIGRISRIDLSRDRAVVEVEADLARSAADLAVEGTRFWVVRPRIGVGWASGLDTLLSGPYVGVEPGPNRVRRMHFQGLETPPPLEHGTQGKQVVLNAADPGSLNVGAPVYYHHFQVGKVIDEQLDSSTGGARVAIFVDAPHDRFITSETRFWNASGVDLNISADGVQLRTQSVASVIAGGIAFDRGPKPEGGPSSRDSDSTLYRDEAAAMAPPDGEPHFVKMRFERPLRGLTVGAPIEFVGVEIGSVISIDVGYEPARQHFPVFVTGKLFPRRIGLAYTMLAAEGHGDTDEDLARVTQQLVARGLRVQARSGSLLTGRMYLALDFVSDATPVAFDVAARPVQLPTTDRHGGELQSSVAKLLDKLNGLPLEKAVQHADQDLAALHVTLDRLNGGVLPAAEGTLGSANHALESVDQLLNDDSAFRVNLEQTLDGAQRTLGSIRALADYLDRNPQALIKGRAKEDRP